MDDREIVSTIRARLADRIGKDRYEVWFGANTQLAMRGEKLLVSVPNQFFQDWLRSNFRKDLEASAWEAHGSALALEFRIVPTLAALPPGGPNPGPGANDAGRQPNGQLPVSASGNGRDAVASTNGHDAHSHGVAGHASGGQPEQPGAPGKPGLCQIATVKSADTHACVGKALPSGRPWATLEAFVVGDSNRLAHQAALMAGQQPGTFSPLLVHGPTGSGKTHLLEGICAAYRKAHRGAAVVYLSAEQFTSYFLEALHGSGMPSFRRKYRDLELLVIDDLQFLSNKRHTLLELVHTTDTILRRGRQLVFSADRSPVALKGLGPELASRLAGGVVCRLDPAEYPTRLGIVRQTARRLGLDVSEEVAGYIASHFTSQTRELVGALKKLQAASQALARPVTLALAEEMLSELVDHHGRVVKLEDIEKAVCDVMGLEPCGLQSACKARLLSHPRMLAMWLARKHTRAGLSEIGSYFGRRSHSTVISAQRKVESWMACGVSMPIATGSVTLEEAIRRVEENLRAG